MHNHEIHEAVYQECLEIELQLQGIPFRVKQQLQLHYKVNFGHHPKVEWERIVR